MRTIVIILLLLSFTSCDASKRAQRHFKKAIDLGMTIDTVEYFDTLRMVTISKDGKDSIIEKIVKVDCPEVKFPEPRYIVKYKYREVKAVAKEETKQIESTNKKEIKKGKLEVRKSKCWGWLEKIFFGIGFFAFGMFVNKMLNIRL